MNERYVDRFIVVSLVVDDMPPVKWIAARLFQIFAVIPIPMKPDEAKGKLNALDKECEMSIN